MAYIARRQGMTRVLLLTRKMEALESRLPRSCSCSTCRLRWHTYWYCDGHAVLLPVNVVPAHGLHTGQGNTAPSHLKP